MTIRNWAVAQAAFAEATFIDPQLVEARIGRPVLLRAQQCSQSNIHSDSRPQQQSDDTNVAAYLSQALLSQGRAADAVPVLRDVLAAPPYDEEARFALASALLQTGNLAAAEDEIDG